MLRLKKKKSRREQMRDRRDDMSILTAGLPIVKVGGGRGRQVTSGWRAPVSKQDLKLKQHFEQARLEAYQRVGERPPETFPINPNPVTPVNPNPNPDTPVNPNRNPDTPVNPNPNPNPVNPQSVEFSVPQPRPPTGYCTIRDLPRLITASEVKAHRNQFQNKQGPVTQQSGLWTSHTNFRQPRRQTAGTIFNSKTKCDTSISSWKICTSGVVDRNTAMRIQQTVANYLEPSQARNPSSIGSSHGLSSFGPSLARGVRPPESSQLFPGGIPNIPATPSSLISGGGVFQSKWVDRNETQMQKPITKQYSIQQLVDVCCGFETPDPILARGLYDPSPAFASTAARPPTIETPSSSFMFRVPEPPRKKSAPVPALGNYQENLRCPRDSNESETSVYFEPQQNAPAAPPKKKVVTFLTDTQDRIKVDEVLFDPFPQSSLRSLTPPSRKENVPPSFFDSFPSPTPSQLATSAKVSELLFGKNPSQPSSQVPSLPELTGQLFSGFTSETPTAAASVSNMDRIFGSYPTPNVFQLGDHHSIGLAESHQEVNEFPSFDFASFNGWQ